VAGSPLDAATVLNAHRDVWQLAVVDLFLSNGSGLAVLDQCKLRHARQHVLVLTNYATPDIRMRCLELGADGVFDKSTELDEFFEVCLRYAQS
jgi:DNA-binding NarL/FixJ family response regulator